MPKSCFLDTGLKSLVCKTGPKMTKIKAGTQALPAALPAPVGLIPSWLDSLPDLKQFRQCTSRQQSTRCCSQSANKQMGHCGWHKEHCKPEFGRREYVSKFFLNLMLDTLISSDLSSFAAEIRYHFMNHMVKELSVKQLFIECKSRLKKSSHATIVYTLL